MLPISPDGGWPLALARGLSVAALLSSFGALIFRGIVLPRVAARVETEGAARHVLRLARWSLVAVLPLLLAWAALQTADFAGAGRQLGPMVAAVPDVIFGTVFGHVWLAQCAAVALTLLLLRRQPGLALLPCAIALILQAGHSHALSMESGLSVLLLSDVVHLLAAGFWLGGLLPLLLTVRSMPPPGGALAARWFSPVGKLCVVAMAVTAGFQGWSLVASIPGLIGTAYGWVALAKLALLGVLFAFAVLNRYGLAPALLRGDAAAAKHRLVRSIAVQTGFGLAVVLAAGVLSNLPPSLHEQPLWPFPQQFSLVTVNEDPEFKQIVAVALLELGGAAAVVAVALALRRFRLVAVGLAVAVAWFAVPDLRLLFVPAYPTSFFASPTGFAATSIVHGAALFQSNCAACHGVGGTGNGPQAASLSIPPADLTAEHLWAHSDGELFWWLTHGIEAPDGSLAMPGFAETLTPEDRWALIDFVRANNAGVAWRDSGRWPQPIAAPAVAISCPDGRSQTLSMLRGRAIRLVFAGGDQKAPALDVPDLTTITVGPAASDCSVADPAVAQAYAVLLGTTADALAGSELLIDPNGWLRSEQPAGTSSAALAALVRDICTNPLAAATEGHHHHAD